MPHMHPRMHSYKPACEVLILHADACTLGCMRAFIFKGAAARERREELGLRAEDVAQAAGISRGHLLALERGQYEPSPPTYMRICKALDVDPDHLRERRAAAAAPSATDSAPQPSGRGRAA